MGWAEIRGEVWTRPRGKEWAGLKCGAGPGPGGGARGGAWAAAREPSGQPSPAEARAHPSAPEPAAPARGDGAGARWGGRCAPAAEEGGAAAQGVQLREPQVLRPGGARLGGTKTGSWPRVGGWRSKGTAARGGVPGGSEGIERGTWTEWPGVEGDWAARAAGAGGGRPREESGERRESRPDETPAKRWSCGRPRAEPWP